MDAWQVGSGHAVEEAHRAPGPPRQSFEPTAIAPGAGDGDGQLRVVGREPGGRLDQGVHALARNQPADAHHELPADGQPDGGPGRQPLIRVERPEARRVDAGRHHGRWQVPARGPAGLRRGVGARGNHVRRPPKDRRQRGVRPG